MSSNIDAQINIIGMSALVEGDKDIDIDQLEKQILNSSAIRKPVETKETIQDKVKRELAKLDHDMPKKEVFSYPEPQHEPFTMPRNFLADTNVNSRQPPIQQQPTLTLEEDSRRIISNMTREIKEDKTFSLEDVRLNDDKAVLIEQVDTLRESLTEDGIDISNIPPVSANDSLDHIRTVYRSLVLKNDRKRYGTLADDIILLSAKGLEKTFNGDNEYFGYKPDLTGWSQTVRAKLKRMRYDTSHFMSGVMQDYKFSSGTRLLLELLPSMFLYSADRSSSRKETKKINDGDFDKALHELNEN